MNIQYVFMFICILLDSSNNGYFVLNSSLILTKGLSSLIGLRFSIKSLKIKIELQSLTKTPIQLRYRTRISSIQDTDSCFIIDINLCKNKKTCNESCVNIEYILSYLFFLNIYIY
jgi:hypothetical protein